MFRVVGVGCPFVCHMPIRWAWMCVCVCARARHSVRSRPFICAFRISHLYFGISLFTPNLYCSMYLWSARLSFFGVCSFVRILLRLLFLLCVSKVTDVGSFFLSLSLSSFSYTHPRTRHEWTELLFMNVYCLSLVLFLGTFFRKSFDAELMPLLMLLLLIHAIFFICATFYRMRFGCVILPWVHIWCL